MNKPTEHNTSQSDRPHPLSSQDPRLLALRWTDLLAYLTLKGWTERYVGLYPHIRQFVPPDAADTERDMVRVFVDGDAWPAQLAEALSIIAGYEQQGYDALIDDILGAAGLRAVVKVIPAAREQTTIVVADRAGLLALHRLVLAALASPEGRAETTVATAEGAVQTLRIHRGGDVGASVGLVGASDSGA